MEKGVCDTCKKVYEFTFRHKVSFPLKCPCGGKIYKVPVDYSLSNKKESKD